MIHDTDCTLEEARELPTFFVIQRTNRPSYACDDCKACRAEPWVNGSACDAHTTEQVAFIAGRGYRRTDELKRRDAGLALAVLRAGGRGEPRYTEGIGLAQWSYRSAKGKTRADKQAYTAAIAGLQYAHELELAA